MFAQGSRVRGRKLRTWFDSLSSNDMVLAPSRYVECTLDQLLEEISYPASKSKVIGAACSAGVEEDELRWLYGLSESSFDSLETVQLAVVSVRG